MNAVAEKKSGYIQYGDEKIHFAIEPRQTDKQKVLRKKATTLGDKVTKEHSSKFVKRMENNWKKYRSNKE